MSGVCERPSAANLPIEVLGGSLTWQKLSPAEFQQLQDFMACKYNKNKLLKKFGLLYNYNSGILNVSLVLLILSVHFYR